MQAFSYDNASGLLPSTSSRVFLCIPLPEAPADERPESHVQFPKCVNWLYWDNGKENGNYYNGLYRGYIGLCWGYIGSFLLNTGSDSSVAPSGTHVWLRAKHPGMVRWIGLDDGSQVLLRSLLAN